MFHDSQPSLEPSIIRKAHNTKKNFRCTGATFVTKNYAQLNKPEVIPLENIKEGRGMKSRLKKLTIVSATHAMAVLFFVFPLTARAQEAGSRTVDRSTQAGSVPRLSDGKPDFTGFWANVGTIDLGIYEKNGCSFVPQLKGCSY